MDITNSIGGLGVLGGRALHLSGRETLLYIKNSNLIISALGSSPKPPLYPKSIAHIFRSIQLFDPLSSQNILQFIWIIL